MFEWYRRAEVCYAYISDVSLAESDHYVKESAFRRSKWFTRGWTLQELLAPQWVEFYDQNWEEIGTKSSLADLITSITGITHLFNFEDACIAQKMSWASRRETTRVEDQAYCLMGLFDVHMPLLYGEGRKAFLRLQLEILSKTDDESLFAWHDSSGNISGLLASTPEQFRYAGNIRRGTFDAKRPPHAMTNQGLRLELLLTSATEENQSTRMDFPLISSTEQMQRPSQHKSLLSPSFLAPLNCILASTDDKPHPGKDNFVALLLCKGIDVNESRAWFRRGQLEIFHLAMASGLQKAVIYTVPDFVTPIYRRPGTVLIRTPSAPEFQFSVSQQYASGNGARWKQNCNEGYMLYSLYEEEKLAALLFSDESSTRFALIFSSPAFIFWVDLVVDVGDLSLEQLLKNFVRSKDSRGGGERISRVLADGRLLSVSSKKEFQVGSYRYVIDITAGQGRRPRYPERNFSRLGRLTWQNQV